jgi:hypothetical protein
LRQILLLFVTADDLKQDLGLFLLKIVADAGACNPGDWQVADSQRDAGCRVHRGVHPWMRKCLSESELRLWREGRADGAAQEKNYPARALSQWAAGVMVRYQYLCLIPLYSNTVPN